tara:strand:- start:342 stop:662 length:321 start_codon:yes stop_codon:yes gene_type:complete
MAFKMRGFSAFTNKNSAFTKKDKDYEPQTKTSKGDPGMVPQTEREKMSITRLEGEIEGIYDNEYKEAKDRGDKTAMKRYERRMLNLKKEIEKKGGKYTHINMSKFG